MKIVVRNTFKEAGKVTYLAQLGDIVVIEVKSSVPYKEYIISDMDAVEILKEVNTRKEKELYSKLQDLCDTKTAQAKTLIAGKDVTITQLERWEEKYKIAKEFLANGNYEDILQFEALLNGITVAQLAEVIVQKGDAYKQALIVFNAKIEAFRVKTGQVIDGGAYDLAGTIIEKAWTLGATSTNEDIIALFEE